MNAQIVFRSARLSARPPHPDAQGLYTLLFGPDRGPARLAADRQDWARHAVAPWVLSHADHPVGVGGFRIGFGGTGLELSFHFLPEVAGQGLASEFVQAALDHAATVLLEDRFFAFVAPDNLPSIRILEKSGFVRDHDRETRDETLMRLHLRPGSGERPARPAS